MSLVKTILTKIGFNNGSQPALNDTNLNQMQTNIQTAISTLETNIDVEIGKIEGILVYENENGSSGNIALTNNIENARYIDIEFSAWGAYSTKRVYSPVNKTILIDGMVTDSKSSTKNFSTSYSVTAMGLTKEKVSWFNRNYDTGGISGNITTNDKLKLHRVVAYF